MYASFFVVTLMESEMRVDFGKLGEINQENVRIHDPEMVLSTSASIKYHSCRLPCLFCQLQRCLAPVGGLMYKESVARCHRATLA